MSADLPTTLDGHPVNWLRAKVIAQRIGGGARLGDLVLTDPVVGGANWGDLTGALYLLERDLADLVADEAP